jgi:hypothetical protein
MKIISLQTYLADLNAKTVGDSTNTQTETIKTEETYHVTGSRYFGWSVRVRGIRGMLGFVDSFETRAEARRYAKYLTNKKVGDPSTWVPSTKGGK